MVPKCLICEVDVMQELDNDDQGYTAVCADCGPYRLSKDVLGELRRGRKLNAPMMKKLIERKYEPDSNPYPNISMHDAVWRN